MHLFDNYQAAATSEGAKFPPKNKKLLGKGMLNKSDIPHFIYFLFFIGYLLKEQIFFNKK